MRILELFQTARSKRQDSDKLTELFRRMQAYIGQEKEARRQVCQSAVFQAFEKIHENPQSPIRQAAYGLCQTLIAFDAHLCFPTVELSKQLSTAQKLEIVSAIKRTIVLFENQDRLSLLTAALAKLTECLISILTSINSPAEEKLTLSFPLYAFLTVPRRQWKSPPS